jgi:hypothetical protein
VKSSQSCPFCGKQIEYERFEEFEGHVAEHRFEQKQQIDSIREFGVQRTFAPYVCGRCNLEFDFDERASEKIKAHTLWHFDEDNKIRMKEEQRREEQRERQRYVSQPEVREKIESFDSEYFGAEESKDEEDLHTPSPNPKFSSNKPLIENIRDDSETFWQRLKRLVS